MKCDVCGKFRKLIDILRISEYSFNGYLDCYLMCTFCQEKNNEHKS